MGIGFVLWGISVIILRRVFGLDADPAALLALPWYLVGAYLGDKLGKGETTCPGVYKRNYFAKPELAFMSPSPRRA